MNDIEIVVTRFRPTQKATIGDLSIDGVHFCFVLEDPDRGLVSDMPLTEIMRIKVPGETAIPTGRYKLGLYNSPKHGKDTIIVHDVPGYEFIEIHSGNWAADTKGCLLPGTTFITDMVQNSNMACKLLRSRILEDVRAGRVWLTVKRAPDFVNPFGNTNEVKA